MLFRVRTAIVPFAVILASCPLRANAGGFDWLQQGIELLFDPAQVAIETSVIGVVPYRNYETINGQPEQVNVLSDVAIPALSAKVTPTQDTACLLSARRPFGIAIDYGDDWSRANLIAEQTLSVDEHGLTCSVGMRSGAIYGRVIGGVTRDQASFEQTAVQSLPAGGTIKPTLSFEGESTSWRTGLAVQIPANAFRASLMYFSEIDLEMQGHFREVPIGGGAYLKSVPISVSASIPQAVEFSMQGSVVANTLSGISVKWMDWSTFDEVPVVARSAAGPVGPGTELVRFRTNFKDGWTVSAFSGIALSSDLSVLAYLLWDRATSTGWTEHTDTWSIFTGARYKLNSNIEIGGGVGLSLYTPGVIDKGAAAGLFNATLDLDPALIAQASIINRF